MALNFGCKAGVRLTQMNLTQFYSPPPFKQTRDPDQKESDKSASSVSPAPSRQRWHKAFNTWSYCTVHLALETYIMFQLNSVQLTLLKSTNIYLSSSMAPISQAWQQYYPPESSLTPEPLLCPKGSTLGNVRLAWLLTVGPIKAASAPCNRNKLNPGTAALARLTGC